MQETFIFSSQASIHLENSRMLKLSIYVPGERGLSVVKHSASRKVNLDMFRQNIE